MASQTIEGFPLRPLEMVAEFPTPPHRIAPKYVHHFLFPVCRLHDTFALRVIHNIFPIGLFGLARPLRIFRQQSTSGTPILIRQGIRAKVYPYFKAVRAQRKPAVLALQPERNFFFLAPRAHDGAVAQKGRLARVADPHDVRTDKFHPPAPFRSLEMHTVALDCIALPLCHYREMAHQSHAGHKDSLAGNGITEFTPFTLIYFLKIHICLFF